MSSKTPSKRPVKPGSRQQPATDGPPPAPDPEVLLKLEAARQTGEALQAQQQRYLELLAQHEALEAAKAEGERESYTAAACLHEELAAREEQVAVLEAEVEALRNKLEAAAAEAAERERAAAAAAELRVAELQRELGAVRAELDSLAEFAAARERLEGAAAGLAEECQRMRLEHAEQVAALQRRLEEAIKALEGSADGEDDSFGGDLRRVVQHNKKITEQMKALSEEAGELQAGVKSLEAQRAQLLLDAKLREEMEQQYALRGTMQAREIKGAASKIVSLERGMQQLASAFEAEKAALVGELRGHLAEAVAEQNTLRRLLKLRTKELNHVRRLAHEVLLQRSDVEAFLLSSIQQVRAEIAREGAGEASLLRLEDAMAASSKVDIRELSWEDRERVLRQLFMRINSQRRSKPPPPVPAEEPAPAAEPAPPSPAPLLQGPFTEAGPAGLA